MGFAVESYDGRGAARGKGVAGGPGEDDWFVGRIKGEGVEDEGGRR